MKSICFYFASLRVRYLLIFLLLTESNAYAQYGMKNFSPIDVCPSNSQLLDANSFQDSKGFVWIASRHGLASDVSKYPYSPEKWKIQCSILRHDGFSAKEIFSVDSCSSTLTEDNEGYLWIAAKDSLIRFDENGIDSIVYLKEPASSILADREGLIWYVTKSGLSILNPPNGREQIIYQSDKRITLLFADSLSQIWFTIRGELLCLNKKTWIPELVFLPIQSKYPVPLYAYYSPRGYIWIVADYPSLQLFKIDAGSRRIVKDIQSLQFSQVYSITEDITGNVWLGTSEGLLQLNAINFTQVFHTKELNSPLPVKSVMVDRSNTLWAFYEGGIMGGGYTGHFAKSNLHAITYYSAFEMKMSRWSTYSSDEDKMISDNNTIWYGFQRLVKIQKGREEINLYDCNGSFYYRYGLKFPVSITSICRKDSNELWIGTNRGLYSFNTKKELFQANNSVKTPVHTLGADKSGKLFVLSEKSLDVISPSGQLQKKISIPAGYLDTAFAYSWVAAITHQVIHEAIPKNIWLKRKNHLLRFSTEFGTVEIYKPKSHHIYTSVRVSASGNVIASCQDTSLSHLAGGNYAYDHGVYSSFSIFKAAENIFVPLTETIEDSTVELVDWLQDKNEVLWAILRNPNAEDYRLCHYDHALGKFFSVTSWYKDARNLKEDPQGNLWFQVNSDESGKTITKYEPKERVLTHYSSGDNRLSDFPQLVFHPVFFTITENGDLISAGAKGLIHFDTYTQSSDTLSSPFRITQIRVNGNPVNVDSVLKAGEIAIPYTSANPLKMSNLLEIEVAVLDYRFPEKNHYTVLFSDKKEISKSGNEKIFRWVDMNSGVYSLNLKGWNSRNVFSPTIKLKVNVSSFESTWIFWITFVFTPIAVCFGLYVGIAYRSYSELVKKQQREQEEKRRKDIEMREERLREAKHISGNIPSVPMFHIVKKYVDNVDFPKKIPMLKILDKAIGYAKQRDILQELALDSENKSLKGCNTVQDVIRLLEKCGFEATVIRDTEEDLPIGNLARFDIYCLFWNLWQNMEQQQPPFQVRVFYENKNEDNTLNISFSNRGIMKEKALQFMKNLDGFPPDGYGLSTIKRASSELRWKIIPQIVEDGTIINVKIKLKNN